MKVIITNLTQNYLSTDIGLLTPSETKTLIMSPEVAYRTAESLKLLVDASRITVTTAEEPNRLDSLEACSLSSLSTATAITLYVDAVNGNDANNGLTVSTAFKTINKALSSVPLQFSNTVKINLKAGTYTEQINDTRIVGVNILGTQTLIIQGVDFVTPVLGSGSLTAGTMGSAGALPRAHTTGGASLSYPVAGAAWITNELKGAFVLFSSGAFNGKYIPIAANTATTIEIPCTGVTGATFTIVKHGAVITTAPALTNAGSSNTNFAVILRRLQFDSNSFQNIYLNGGSLWLDECSLTRASFANIFLAGPNCRVQMTKNYVQNSGGSCLLSQQDGVTLIASGNVFEGGASGLNFAGSVDTVNFLTANLHNIVQNSTVQGISFATGPKQCFSQSTAKWVIRGSVTGMLVGGGGHFDMQNWEFFSNSGAGIRLRADGGIFGYTSLNIQNVCIQDNGSHGISCDSAFNHVRLLTGDVSGNAYGVVVGANGGGVGSAFNRVSVGSAVTMTANVTNDFLFAVPNTTSTLTALRAATNKLFEDTPSHNSIQGA